MSLSRPRPPVPGWACDYFTAPGFWARLSQARQRWPCHWGRSYWSCELCQLPDPHADGATWRPSIHGAQPPSLLPRARSMRKRLRVASPRNGFGLYFIVSISLTPTSSPASFPPASSPLILTLLTCSPATLAHLCPPWSVFPPQSFRSRLPLLNTFPDRHVAPSHDPGLCSKATFPERSLTPSAQALLFLPQLIITPVPVLCILNTCQHLKGSHPFSCLLYCLFLTSECILHQNRELTALK